MSIIPTSLGNPQCTDVAVESQLPMTGNATRQDLQSTLSQNDAEVSKLYEDRNVQLTQGGSISYDSSGTFLTLSENLNLEINSQVAGGSPTIIPIFSGSPPYTINVSASGNLGYAVIDRIGGTATYYDNQTSLPAVVYANQEVFLIGKRDDSGDAMMRFYFRQGTAITAGQTIRLGSSSFSGTISGSDIEDDSIPITKEIPRTIVTSTGTVGQMVRSGTVTTSTTLISATIIANLTLTTNGGPVRIELGGFPASGGGMPSSVYLIGSPTGGGYIDIDNLTTSTSVAGHEITSETTNQLNFPASSFSATDYTVIGSPGTYNYTVAISNQNGGNTIGVNNVETIIWEMI
jgi:hypothetical protein